MLRGGEENCEIALALGFILVFRLGFYIMLWFSVICYLFLLVAMVVSLDHLVAGLIDIKGRMKHRTRIRVHFLLLSQAGIDES